MDNILRVGLMCRVSTEEQALHGDSMQAQEDSLVAYANENNMKIVNIYRDGGFSARKPVLKRPAMLELLEDIKSGRLDMVLFTKLDRWFRNIKEYYKIQEILERNKVTWRAILEDYNTATADGRLKVNIMLSVAENEADRTSERIKFIFQSKLMRKEAIFPNQCAPFGYKIVKINGVNKLVKDDENREAVEYFFKTALSTQSIRNASILTNKKFNLTRDYQGWLRTYSNTLYYGEYKGIENFCEPYITKAEFNELHKNGRVRTAKNNRVYIFRGMIKCPHCGRIMVSKFNVNKNGKEYHYYRCSAAEVKKCNTKYLPEKTVEDYVLENVSAKLEQYILSHEAKQPKPKKKKTDTSKLKEQLRRINVSYQLGNMEDEEYIAKTKELKAMIEKATKEEAPDTPVDISALKDFLNSGFEEIYASLDPEDKRRLWNSIIEEIIYDGETVVDIKFKA